MHRVVLVLLVIVTVLGCRPSGPETIHVQVRPAEPGVAIEPGEHALGLGGYRLVNRSVIWRDGILYIPRISKSRKPLPLLVWLHGGGGKAESFRYMFPLAEEFGVVILALDARHNTWDGIDSPFGPDVLFMDAALQKTFQRVAIDPQRVTLGGLSDGAAYALALGRVNGDLFTRLVAVAPGRLDPPGPEQGQPRIFVAHGIRDSVYSVLWTRRYILPRLKGAGYDVTYHEFDGPHWVPVPVAREMLKWITQ